MKIGGTCLGFNKASHASQSIKLVDFALDEFVHDRVLLNDLATHRWVKNFLATKKATRGGLEAEILARETYQGEPAIELIRFGTKSDGAQIVPGMAPFESHHSIPKYIQKKLQACLNKVGQWNLDDVPAVLETRPDHMFGTTNSLHARIFEMDIRPGQMGLYGDNAAGANDILNRLQQAYENAQRPDLVKVVMTWRQTIQ